MQAQLTVPLFLKWALVWDHVDDQSVWLGKAAPREMVGHAAGIVVERVPTQYGRVSFSMRVAQPHTSTLDANDALSALVRAGGVGGGSKSADHLPTTSATVDVNVTVPTSWGSGAPSSGGAGADGRNGVGVGINSMVPPGGLYIRARLPIALGWRLARANVNGISLPAAAVDAGQETVHLAASLFRKVDLTRSIRLTIGLEVK
jgi:hypothetical protein